MRRSDQRGVALILVLTVLVVVTLLGMVALRGVLMEERMSAHMSDRSRAFQAAESALRTAEDKVREAAEAGRPIGVDCASAGVTCPGTPANVGTASSGKCAANTPGCWLGVAPALAHSAEAAGAPQYYIEYMGNIEVSVEGAQSRPGASAGRRGAAQTTHGRSIYRISARSHDARGDRALVALQATLEWRKAAPATAEANASGADGSPVLDDTIAAVPDGGTRDRQRPPTGSGRLSRISWRELQLD